MPVSNLMDIDTRQNRLIYGYAAFGRRGAEGYVPSLLNLGDALDPYITARWENDHSFFRYALVRRAELLPGYENRYGGQLFYTPEDLRVGSRHVARTIERYRKQQFDLGNCGVY